MPEFKGVLCEGTCERFGLECQQPEHYVKVATQYKCKPMAYKHTIKIGDRDAVLAFTALNVPEKNVREASMMIGRNTIATVDENGELFSKALLQELPCFLECDYYRDHLRDKVLPKRKLPDDQKPI